MRDKRLHMGFWIDELKGYGVHENVFGQAIEDLSYEDLLALLVKTHFQLNIEIKESPWF